MYKDAFGLTSLAFAEYIFKFIINMLNFLVKIADTHTVWRTKV